MAYTLGAAWYLSSCHKAQTRHQGTLFVAVEYHGDWSDPHQAKYTEELVEITADGRARCNGPARTHQDFLAELAKAGLGNMETPIWHPIGYTPIPAEPHDGEEGCDGR